MDGLLANAGISINDMRPVLVPNLIRGIDELIAGRVDVSFFALGQAKIAEAEAAISGGIRFLPVDTTPAAVEAMLKVVQVGYVDRVNPAPNLPGVREPIMVAHYDYVAFANKDVPAERVKTITRVLAEQKDAMAQSLPLFRRLAPDRCIRRSCRCPITTAPSPISARRESRKSSEAPARRHRGRACIATAAAQRPADRAGHQPARHARLHAGRGAVEDAGGNRQPAIAGAAVERHRHDDPAGQFRRDRFRLRQRDRGQRGVRRDRHVRQAAAAETAHRRRCCFRSASACSCATIQP